MRRRLLFLRLTTLFFLLAARLEGASLSSPAAALGNEPDPEDEILSLTLPANPTPHDSYFRLSGEVGTGGYQDYLAEPRIALSDHWAIIGQLDYLENQPGLFSREGIGGLEWRSRDVASFSFSGVLGDGPGPVTSSGWLVDAAGWLEGLWGGRLQTIVRFEAAGTRFSVPYTSAKGVDEPGIVHQTELQLLLTQELAHDFLVTIGYTGFLYDRSIEALSAVIGNAKVVSSGSIGQVQFFVRHAWLAQLDWGFTRNWIAELSASSTLGVTSTEPAVGTQLVLRYRIDRSWLVGASATVSYQGAGEVYYSGGPEVELSW